MVTRCDLPLRALAAKAALTPAAVCVKTDRDANLAIAMERLLRFTEVYQAPMG